MSNEAVGVADGVPAPPPGPGVAPPFPAPPTDRSRRGLWIGLGVGALALVVCCAGGLFGIGLIIVNGTDLVRRQARDAVGVYLQALVDRDYDRAYNLLCASRRAQTSPELFTEEQRRAPHPESFTVQDPEITDAIRVPADVTYDTGGSRIVRYLVIQNRSTAEFNVCGETG